MFTPFLGHARTIHGCCCSSLQQDPHGGGACNVVLSCTSAPQAANKGTWRFLADLAHPWYLALDLSPPCLGLQGPGGSDFREKLEGVDGNLRLPVGSSVTEAQGLLHLTTKTSRAAAGPLS